VAARAPVTSSSPIHVCHLVSDDAWGGAEAVVAALLRAQAQRGDLRVELIALNPGRLTRLAAGLAIPVQVTPETGRGFVPLLRDVDAWIGGRRPQIVHSHRYKENLLSYLIARRHGARSVVTLHGEESPERLATRLALGARYFAMHSLARLVGARFAAVSADLRSRFPMLAARCRVIPNGVALPPLAEDGPAARRDGAVIGWVGRLVPIKQLPVLIEALALLAARDASARLLLVGDGPERAALAALAQRLGVAQRVEFAGFVENPAQAFARMDLFALPSLHEGLPVALLEAMAAGLPCVAAAVGGIPEVEGGAGAIRLVPSHAPQAWADALAELLASAELRRALGARARARIAARFSIEAAADAYAALYRSALAGGAA
jgi:glycosyltransferase involved in cell wall biosynthesis